MVSDLIYLLQELDLYDILSFDSEFGKILQELQLLVCRKQYLEAVGGDNSDAISNLCFRGAPIEDLCLDFTLPGYPDYILTKGDENVQQLQLPFVFLLITTLVRMCLTFLSQHFRLISIT